MFARLIGWFIGWSFSGVLVNVQIFGLLDCFLSTGPAPLQQSGAHARDCVCVCVCVCARDGVQQFEYECESQ